MLMTNVIITMTGIFYAVYHSKMKLTILWRLDLPPFLARKRDRENLLIQAR
jgi:hypothetical protein